MIPVHSMYEKTKIQHYFLSTTSSGKSVPTTEPRSSLNPGSGPRERGGRTTSHEKTWMLRASVLWTSGLVGPLFMAWRMSFLVCVCVWCVCMYVCVRVPVCVCVCVCVWAYIYSVYVYACISYIYSVYVYACICVRAFIQAYVVCVHANHNIYNGMCILEDFWVSVQIS